MGKLGKVTRGARRALAAAARVLIGEPRPTPAPLALDTSTGPSPDDDYRAWVWADDRDPNELGELNRRMIRDTARRMIDREAVLITRGRRSRDLAWIAQEIRPAHPHRAAVRALAMHTGTPVAPLYPSGERARERARRADADRQFAELLATLAGTAERSMKLAHARSATLALRLALAWRRPCAPRAPAPERLA